ncbi:MAG TPA: SDR family oxidoreductase [Lacipirellulaceae bacterium]|jgi:gluconate 5-dehydrogenase|nr:SDR family oxidoreductase [Lacipirellulaceae bacterium]
MNQPFSLVGETILITGGGTGLGFGMAKCFVQCGAKVVLVGRRCDVLKKAAAQLGESALWEAHDILELGEAANFISRLRDRSGAITGLVNNAGIHIKKSAVELLPEEFLAVLQTHLVASFALCRAVLPGMIERRHGNILFISSMASLFGIPLVSAYSAAKAGHLGLMRSLATEVSPYGIRVNSIAPGWIESEMMRGALNGDPKRAEKVLGRTPMNQFGDAEDVGWAASFLCSPAAKFITGVVMPVDGGASIGF